MNREPGDKRTGTFTSGIVSTTGPRKIALYFTGRQHAGENLADVLRQRARELGPRATIAGAPADFATMARFCRVLDSIKARFGIIIGPKGISGA